METMNIAMPSILKDFVQRRVGEGGYGSVSEYVRELIRLDHRRVAQGVLETELLHGLASGAPAKMTKAEWARLRREVGKRVPSRKRH
ncbi:MAG: type II toxin-antitoxin system ParD family antitoxin [Thermoguttaceae bacterium]|jgi:antitoxin ParD1/3/4